jgi:hypothetical protein
MDFPKSEPEINSKKAQMRINEFEFTSDNHFVAMEYHWLILNRTFPVLIMDNELIGIKVHGPIGVESSDALVNLLPLTVDGDLQNPSVCIEQHSTSFHHF